MKTLGLILGALLIASAGVGTYISATDSYLWAEAPSHAYGLIVFIGVDLVAAAALYLLPRASRTLALLLPAAQFVTMAGDLYVGLGSPGSVVQNGFREYLLNDSPFMVLFLLQAVLIGLALGYFIQPPMNSLGTGDASASNHRRDMGSQN